MKPEPSALLVSYREVAARRPIPESDLWIAELRNANQRQFALDLAKMEREYAEVVGRAEQPAVSAVAAVVEPGECLGLAERWLEENGG